MNAYQNSGDRDRKGDIDRWLETARQLTTPHDDSSFPVAVDSDGNPLDPTFVTHISLPREGAPATSDSIFGVSSGINEEFYQGTDQELLEQMHRQGFRGVAIFRNNGPHPLAEEESKKAVSRTDKYPRTDCRICSAFIAGHDRMRGYKLLEFRHAGQFGCPTCSVIYRGVSHFARMLSLDYEDWESNILRQKTVGDSKLLSESTAIKVNFIQNDENVASLSFSCSGRVNGAGMEAEPEPTIRDTSSYAAMKLVQGWIQTCLGEHEACEIRHRTAFPPRLLDVSNHSVKLVLTEGQEGSYLALSHCWGLTQIIRTERANIKDRMQGIPWQKLSKTFQDAIIFTWKLGYRYIWIDSLCIIQDDKEDWEVHSSKMAEIFSNAQLTISATRAKGGADGCFSIRSQEPFEFNHRGERRQIRDNPDIWSSFHTTARDRDGIVKDLFLRIKPRHGVQHDPLLKRAWVFQEQILSPRIVHFASGELYWECQSYVCCECIGWEKRSESLQLETRRRKAHNQLVRRRPSLQNPFSTFPEQERERDFEAYRSLIEQYTNTDITFDLDRLPALSGIAFGRHDEYLAGMWKSILVESLHWISTRSLSHAMAYRPFENKAPSWSWVAIKSPVRHIGEFSAEFRDSIYGKGKVLAKVVAASCTTEGADERGRVESGYLKIQGLTTRCKVTRIGLRDSPNLHQSDSYGKIAGHGVEGEFELDVPIVLARTQSSEVSPGEDLLLLQLSQRVALILQDIAEAPGAYRRVGISCMDKEDLQKWFAKSVIASIFVL